MICLIVDLPVYILIVSCSCFTADNKKELLVVEENFWDARSASNGSRSPSVMSDQLEQPKEMVKEKKRASEKKVMLINCYHQCAA